MRAERKVIDKILDGLKFQPLDPGSGARPFEGQEAAAIRALRLPQCNKKLIECVRNAGIFLKSGLISRSFQQRRICLMG
jgi:hypothetical protein